MKKIKIFLFGVLAAVAAVSGAAAQTNGGIDASDIRLTHTGNEVLLEMTLRISGDAVTKCQSMAVVPTLHDGERSANFPYVLVNGRKAAKQFARRVKFGNTELLENPPLKVVDMKRRQGGTVTIPYSARIPAAAWMNDASLRIGMLLISCAGERQRYSMETSFETVRPAVPVASPPAVAEPPAKQPETISLSGSAYLNFLPDSYDIMSELGNNARELADMHALFDRVKNTPGAEFTGLAITGFASPEARFSRNERLAYNRAFALAGHLQTYYGISPSNSMVDVGGEDWVKLRRLVVESGIAHKSEILAIIDGSDHPDVKESRLRRLAGGGPWRTMMDEMFPQLRRVEYRVDYVINEKIER